MKLSPHTTLGSAFATLLFNGFFLATTVTGLDPLPLPLRGQPPDDAVPLLRWSGRADTVVRLKLRGNELSYPSGHPGQGSHRLLNPLPQRRVALYAKVLKGRGYVAVLEDPTPENEYEAVVSIRDVGAGARQYDVILYYSEQIPPMPNFWQLIHVDREPDIRRRASHSQCGTLWGEQLGSIRGLTEQADEPSFVWKGKVDKYAQLIVGRQGLRLRACGYPGAATTHVVQRLRDTDLQNKYLVLSRCHGEGRVRVLQGGSGGTAGQLATIEIDSRYAKRKAYELRGVFIRRDRVEALYRPEDNLVETWQSAREAEGKGQRRVAARLWLRLAISAQDDRFRLWALEKFCMLAPYPGPELNGAETQVIRMLDEQEHVQVLRGHNLILAWPPHYVRNTMTAARFLAEVDATMEWMKVLTGTDPVAARGKRMISRFRLDKSGASLYTSFRLHISRAHMQVPPDHGPYSHEVSHGFVPFPAIIPSPRYGEALTGVMAMAYWDFLGADHIWKPHRRHCLYELKQHLAIGKDTVDPPNNAIARGVYLVLIDEFCRDKDGSPDWQAFARLLEVARSTRVPDDPSKRQLFVLLAKVCEGAFGHRALQILGDLGLPTR